MKSGLLIRITAAVAALFYIATLVGFDIHIDREYSHVYVRSMLADLSCEHIHPHDECGHSHDGCEDEEDCCEDIAEQNTSFTIAPGSIADPAPAVLELHIPEFRPSDEALLPVAELHDVPASHAPPLSLICILRV